jgi:hypothetical protein
MAIKINNTTVIDDSRNFIGVALTATSIYASGTVGTAGSVLTSTGTGIEWTTPTAGGGSGSFDTGITTSVYVSVSSGLGTNAISTNNIFVGPGIAYSFSSTAGRKYILESIHVTNKSGNNLYLSGRHDFNGGVNVPIANHIIVPYQGSFELLEQPRVANLSDIIRLQALTGIGTDALGHDGGLDAFITISSKTDTNYIGVGKTVTSTDEEIFTSVTYPSVIQSISLANYNDKIDVDVTVSLFRGGSVGGISTTGIRQGYLAYNLTLPKNSTIEVCQKPKLLLAGDSILVTTTPANSVGIVLAGKYIV